MARTPKPRRTPAGTWEWRVGTYRKADGSRAWVRGTEASQAGAQAKIAEVIAARHRGAPIADPKVTVGQILAAYRLKRARGAMPGTVRNLDAHLERIGRYFGGHRAAVSVRPADAEAFMAWLRTPAGGKRGRPLAAVTANATLSRAKGAFAYAFDTAMISHRPFAQVDYDDPEGSGRGTWTRPQLVAFLAGAAGHPLFAAFLLATEGLRPEELNGLRWDRVRLGAVTLDEQEFGHGLVLVAETRVRIGGVEYVQPPKSARGVRSIRLNARLNAALVALQAAQMETPVPGANPDGYVFTDELGAPVKPWRIAAEFHKVRERAGLPRIVLYGLRHTINSELAIAQVPVGARAAGMGHGKRANVTYTHQTPALRAEIDKITGQAG